MPKIEIQVPVQIELATVSFEVPVDSYLSVTFRDAGGKALHEIEEDAPDFLKERFGRAAGRSLALTLEVDLETGIVKNWPKPPVDFLERISASAARILAIHTKIRDGFSFRLLDPAGHAVITQTEDYVPGFMPGQHYGDYVILDIDLETGAIAGWDESCTQRDLQTIADAAPSSPYMRISPPARG